MDIYYSFLNGSLVVLTDNSDVEYVENTLEVIMYCGIEPVFKTTLEEIAKIGFKGLRAKHEFSVENIGFIYGADLIEFSNRKNNQPVKSWIHPG